MIDSEGKKKNQNPHHYNINKYFCDVDFHVMNAWCIYIAFPNNGKKNLKILNGVQGGSVYIKTTLIAFLTLNRTTETIVSTWCSTTACQMMLLF